MKRLLTTAMVLVMLATIFCASPVVTAAGSPNMDLLVINESNNTIAVSPTFTDVENATWVVWSIKNADDEFIFIDEKRGDEVAENGFDPFVLKASEVEAHKNKEFTVEARVSYPDSPESNLCEKKFTLINYNSAKTVIKDILTEEKSIAEGAKILTMALPSYYQSTEATDEIIINYLLADTNSADVDDPSDDVKYSDFIAADETTFNAMDVDTNDFYSDLLEAILYASINSKNSTVIANIVANYYTTLNDSASIVEAEKKWYDEASDKADIAKKMATFTYNDKTDFYKQFKAVVFLNKLSGTSIEEFMEFLEINNKTYYIYYLEEDSDLLLGGSTKLTLDFDKYKELATTEKRVSYAENYMVGTYTDLEAVKTKFNKLLELLPDVKEESKNEGGSGSIGSGSGSGSGSTISVGLVAPIVGQQASPFSDIDDVEWAKEAIVALAKEGVIEGVSAKQYQPNANVTREQFVKIIVNTFGLKGTGVKAEFKDADQNEWYAYYINTAVELGIIKGASDDHFGVGENITRQDMTLIMYRVAKYKGINVSAKSGRTFSDADSVDGYAIDAVTALYQAGIVNGVADGVFGGWQTATRAQAAKLCYDLRESK